MKIQRRLINYVGYNCLVVAYRSDNFIVGLSNSYPASRLSVLGNYDVCGQYPGPVPGGSTVTVQCTNVCERGLHYKYVIVQFPLIADQMNFCEVEVYAIGTIPFLLLRSGVDIQCA